MVIREETDRRGEKAQGSAEGSDDLRPDPGNNKEMEEEEGMNRFVAWVFSVQKREGKIEHAREG